MTYRGNPNTVGIWIANKISIQVMAFSSFVKWSVIQAMTWIMNYYRHPNNQLKVRYSGHGLNNELSKVQSPNVSVIQMFGFQIPTVPTITGIQMADFSPDTKWSGSCTSSIQMLWGHFSIWKPDRISDIQILPLLSSLL